MSIIGEYLRVTPAQLERAAHTLRTLSYDRLIEGVSSDDLTRAEVYPSGGTWGCSGGGALGTTA
ncbi:hypothetical protein ACIPWL_26975 [Streptomyces sp. NPDC090023]|uniref:hypothetical protein n=1 Tax=unclassified Streptomyces TaxID=2593676 RepID=UPI003817F643